MTRLLAILPLVIPLTADAALLMELKQQGGGNVSQSQVGGPIAMEFSVGPIGNWDARASLEGQFTTAQVGMTFSATPTEVELFDQWLTYSDALFLMHVGSGGGPGGDLIDELWRTDWPPDFRVFTTYVPRLGVGLAGYRVTEVTQTIDQLEYYMPPGSLFPASRQAMTVRIYGHVVPEPVSALLLAHVLVGYVWIGGGRLARGFVNDGD
jgi:hypothetical protein